MKLSLFLIFGIFLFLVTGVVPEKSAAKNICNIQAPIPVKYDFAVRLTTISLLQNQNNTPDSLIRELYKTHDRDAGSIVQGRNRAILDKFFEKNLAGLIWRDITTHKEEVGVIDIDIFYNTQDPEISNLVINAPKFTSGKASVLVSFRNARVKQSVNYLLTKQNSGWKISDIQYGKGRSLMKYFNENQN